MFLCRKLSMARIMLIRWSSSISESDIELNFDGMKSLRQTQVRILYIDIHSLILYLMNKINDMSV